MVLPVSFRAKAWTFAQAQVLAEVFATMVSGISPLYASLDDVARRHTEQSLGSLQESSSSSSSQDGSVFVRSDGRYRKFYVSVETERNRGQREITARGGCWVGSVVRFKPTSSTNK